MRHDDELITSVKSNGTTGFFRLADLAPFDVSRDQLRPLLRSGRVERIGRGLYRVTDEESTENYSLAMVAARVPTSIICLLTALRFHQIGTQSPPDVWLAIPHKARPPRVPEVGVRIIRFTGSAWSYGVDDVMLDGVPARITSPARTVADCFRLERVVGTDVAIEALLDALRRRKTTIAELSRVEAVLPSRRPRMALELQSI